MINTTILSNAGNQPVQCQCRAYYFSPQRSAENTTKNPPCRHLLTSVKNSKHQYTSSPSQPTVCDFDSHEDSVCWPLLVDWQWPCWRLPASSSQTTHSLNIAECNVQLHHSTRTQNKLQNRKHGWPVGGRHDTVSVHSMSHVTVVTVDNVNGRWFYRRSQATSSTQQTSAQQQQPHVTWHMSCHMTDMSHDTCDKSCDTCHVTWLTCHMSCHMTQLSTIDTHINTVISSAKQQNFFQHCALHYSSSFKGSNAPLATFSNHRRNCH